MHGDVKNIEQYAAAIEVFVKKLDAFIKESVANINKMKQRHQKMASVWKDDSYTQFTAVLAKSIKEAAKELSALQKLKEDLIAKLKILRS